MVDRGLTGQFAIFIDIVMQRLKVQVVAILDGSWKAAQHMEQLLPATRGATVLSMEDEGFIR